MLATARKLIFPRFAPVLTLLRNFSYSRRIFSKSTRLFDRPAISSPYWLFSQARWFELAGKLARLTWAAFHSKPSDPAFLRYLRKTSLSCRRLTGFVLRAVTLL